MRAVRRSAMVPRGRATRGKAPRLWHVQTVPQHHAHVFDGSTHYAVEPCAKSTTQHECEHCRRTSKDGATCAEALVQLLLLGILQARRRSPTHDMHPLVDLE